MNLPADIDAELGAVGAVIERQGQGLDDLLEPGILTSDNAIRLRNVVRALVSEGQAIDSVTVGMRFDDDQLLGNAIDKGTPGLAFLLPILRQKAALRSILTNAEKDMALVARLDHERRDIAAPLAEAVLRSDAERRETLDRITGTTVAEQSIFFSGASRSWWVRTTAGSFVEMDKAMIVKELTRLGIGKKQKGESLGEIDQFLLRTAKDPVAYSGPLAGHKAGPIDHPGATP